MVKHVRNQDGFTLIEALMAMVILTIGILALNTLQVTSVNGNATSNHLTLASSTAVSGYERLLGMPYNSAAMDPAGNPHNQNEIAGFMLPDNVSQLAWNVTEWSNTDGIDNDGDGNVDESDELNVKAVSITVTYTDRTNKTLTAQFLKSEMY